MINNYGKNMYHAIRTLEMEKEDDTPKPEIDTPIFFFINFYFKVY